MKNDKFNLYEVLFNHYEKFFCNNYYALLKYNNDGKYNLLNIHIFIEISILRLISSFKVKQYEITLNIYSLIFQKIKDNIFLERYSYRLEVVFQYMLLTDQKKFVSLIKENNNLQNNDSREQDNSLNKKILDFYRLI